MADYRPWIGPLVVVVLILAAAYLVAYPLSSSTQISAQTTTTSAPFTVNLAYKAGIGFYLTNASGFTLYFRATDPGNGSSTCTGGCVKVWPLFYAGNGAFNLPSSLGASSFGLATRADGQKETTFNGYPLYYFANDKAPGQVNGEGKGGFYACCSIVTATSSTTTTAP